MSFLAISNARIVGSALVSAPRVPWRSKIINDLEGETMLQVRRDLCIGCGLCIENCPQQAISLLWNQASIDQSRCNQCSRCVEICSQGAIVELVLVSAGELRNTVISLKQKTNNLMERIEKLTQRSR